MDNREPKMQCPVCGRPVSNREHSRMGTIDLSDGRYEYWACYFLGDVFSVKISGLS